MLCELGGGERDKVRRHDPYTHPMNILRNLLPSVTDTSHLRKYLVQYLL